MTILALDVGNTHIVLGCVRDGEIVSVARMATQAIKTEDEYAIEISAILMEELYDELDGPVARVAAPDVPIPYNIALEHYCVPDAARIAEAVRAQLAHD